MDTSLNTVPIKPQTLRLLDTFLWGPVLLYAATQLPRKPVLRLGVAGFAIGMMIYEFRNYRLIEQQKPPI